MDTGRHPQLPGRSPPVARRVALEVLLEPDPRAKAERLCDLRIDPASIDPEDAIEEPAGIPGRPDRPPLVPHTQIPRRSAHTQTGRAILLHAIAHIEFNAINLALDAVWRFSHMPPAYYLDWLEVAREEARHFSLLDEHLRRLGFEYGQFPAHDALWEMALKTCGDVLARMALVPRILEARGLDASPLVRAKLAAAGDHRAASIIDIILRDEIGHVAIGNRWFHWLCAKRGVDPVPGFAALARQYAAPRPRGPFNLDARRAAGFDEAELAALTADAP